MSGVIIGLHEEGSVTLLVRLYIFPLNFADMRIALSQQNYHIGNFQANTQKILSDIERAKKAGAELIVFSELSVCGYPPLDFLEFEDFITQSLAAVKDIKSHSQDIGVIIGAPQRNNLLPGKRLFNSAWLLYNGQVEGIAQKTLLPTYDIFDEYRHFEPASEWKIIPFKNHRIALTICEDLWNLGDNPQYPLSPMDILAKQNPDIIINISASPFAYGHNEDRKAMIQSNVLKYGLPLVYCNATGAQTEIIFDGGSLVYDAEGRIVQELPYFEESLGVVDISPGKKNGLQTIIDQPETPSALNHPQEIGKENAISDILNHLTGEENIGQIHRAIILGIRDYFIKMGFSKAILGSSGGIDSAVALSLACEALGSQHVRAVLMPSPFSTPHSVDDGVQLSKNLNNPFDIISISESYHHFLTLLDPLFKGLPFNVAEENIQSRLRGNLLMAIANKFGNILINTSNKSELATGYGTLYGDMAGGLSVLGDVYKTQVYALAKYINREKEIIPAHILSKPPSAELRPDQKDSDSLPDYSILDPLLYLYIEQRKGPKEILKQGFDLSLVNRVLKMVNGNEYKRRQFCPVLRVSAKAFGAGRRIPIVGKHPA